MLKTAQGRMLRWMLGTGRRHVQAHQEDVGDEPEPEETPEERDLEHEPWIECIITTTGIVEAQLGKLGLDGRVTAAALGWPLG